MKSCYVQTDNDDLFRFERKKLEIKEDQYLNKNKISENMEDYKKSVELKLKLEHEQDLNIVRNYEVNRVKLEE